MSVEEYKKLIDRSRELETKKREELGLGPDKNVHNELMDNEEYQEILDKMSKYDKETKKQARALTQKNGNGRRKSKKSKRKHRKTRR
jgi:hypothetical protein